MVNANPTATPNPGPTPPPPRRRADVLVEPLDDASRSPRFTGPATGDERAMLVRFLADQRRTLVLKCEGLTHELAARSAAPSTLSLLGLVRHLADVERRWFREILAAEPGTAPLFSSPASPDGDFDEATADPASVAEAWTAWHAAVAYAEDFTEKAPDLDVTGEDDWRGTVSLRWVLIHMIEEYARHNGHADLLRERLDGATGV
ncbi:DinB family protein [Streptomyces sp. NPDC056144]|uniref:DinB family protein n=1 Tax=unclassified Streptomyces TaxID=2593676 RepID=UPI0035D875FC